MDVPAPHYFEERIYEDEDDFQFLSRALDQHLTQNSTSKTVQTSQKEYSLVLYVHSNCPYCIKVMRSLNSLKKKIPIKDIGKDPAAMQELITLGGKKQVPCLFINGNPHYESDWIINWLKAHKSEY